MFHWEGLHLPAASNMIYKQTGNNNRCQQIAIPLPYMGCQVAKAILDLIFPTFSLSLQSEPANN